MRPILMAAAAITALLPIAASAAAPKGVWTNPRKSVRVQFVPCGDAICGKVIAATPQAEADAQRGGGAPLVGAMLFQDFRQNETGLWNGSVLVPDLGQTITGTIRQVDANTLVGEGCVFANIGCRTQTWTRVK
jgi:uncharacterized protein (DUF2147 family)